jgi:hypothetical protein
MTYAKIENGSVAEYPVYEGDIRLRFPNTSFPLPFEPPSGFVAVVDVPQPQVDHTKVVTEGDLQLVAGKWRRTWVVADAPAEVLAERTAAQAAGIRAERNSRLSRTDWTQISDAPGSTRAAYVQYRQALRDVSQQVGFPWTVTWPTEP